MWCELREVDRVQNVTEVGFLVVLILWVYMEDHKLVTEFNVLDSKI